MRRRYRVVSLILLLGLVALVRTSGARIDGTTAAGVAKGLFEIRGITQDAIHTHGGPPAQISHVRFGFVNRSSQAHRVTVTDIEYLQGPRDCDQPPSKVVSHPKLTGISIDDAGQRESAPHVEVKAGATVQATVRFAAVQAYYVHCDRFAIRVHFQVGSEKIAVVDEITVTREEPLRERHEDRKDRLTK